MNVFRGLAILFVAASLTSCATAPATHAVTSSRAYNRPYDQVWEDLVGFFASHNIQVKNIAKDSGVIYAETTRFDDTIADCGKPGILIVEARRANYNVFVNRSGAEPVVSVNTEFLETRRFDTSRVTVPCNSRGVLEAKILDSVRQ